MSVIYLDKNGNRITEQTWKREQEKKKKQKEKEKQERKANEGITLYLGKNGKVTVVDERPNGTLADKVSQKEKEIDNDLAPVKDRTWFQAGAYEDGYQFGDFTKSLSATIDDAGAALWEGVLGIAEKTVDAGAYLVGGAGRLLGADGFADSVEGFIEKDLIDEEKVAKFLVGDFTEDREKNSWLGEKTDSLLQSGGQLVGQIVLQAAGIPWWVTTATTSFGGESESALKQGASYAEAGISAAVSTAAEILTEKLFGGSGLGEKGLIKLDVFTKGVSNKAVKTLLDFGIDVAAEGSEEVVSEFVSTLGQQLTYEREETIADLVSNEEAMDAYLRQVGESLFGEEAREAYGEAFIGGAVLGGGINSVNVAKSLKKGTDYRTGQNANEEAVFNREVANRIAEAEADGKKLTNKEKAEIEAEVEADLEKGRISADTIESVLGGDAYTAFEEGVKGFGNSEDYKAYQDAVAEEKAIQEEFESLQNMKAGEATIGQQDRYNELKARIEEFKTKSRSAELRAKLEPEIQRINELKKQLQTEVMEKVKGDRLSETYRELQRSKEKFQADPSKYENEYAKKTIQNIIDGGIANNTKEFHEFADFMAKMSADKGLVFDLTDNAKLTGTRYEVKGATVNAFVTKDGNIVLNKDSKKRLNSLVGHEVTHVLEGTEFYNELANAVKDYATKKGEYDTRLQAVTELYQKYNPEADPVKELTADLVGDYIFTDKAFIENLSVNHRNIFQKIYDEIKYMAKIATAGSKEARALEKAKKAFADAYRASGQVKKNATENGGVQYSFGVTQSDIDSYVDAAYEDTNGEDYKKYAEVSDRLLNDVADEIDLTGYSHALRDNDIRHIRNSHGENTPEKYPVTKADIKNIPWIVENYDKTVVVQRKGLDPGIFYVKAAENGLVYYLEQATTKYGGERLLVNKQMIKTGIEDIPDLPGLRDAIEKKQSVTEFLDDLKTVPEVYVQDVYQSHSDTIIAENSEKSSGEAKNSLSPEQEAYFKDSVVRDENGNLKVMYHGTSKGGHTVFDPYGAARYGLFGLGTYFTDSRTIAESYTKKGKGDNPQVYETYLNITNPMDMDAPADPAAWAKVFPDADFPASGTNEDFYRAMEEYFEDMEYVRWEAHEAAMDAIMSMGYDGITHIGGGRVNADGPRHQVYIAFQPEQIKAVDNANPTDNPDIHRSLSENGEAPVRGRGYAVYGENIRVRDPSEFDFAPLGEYTAPVQEDAAPVQTTPVQEEPLAPDDYAPATEADAIAAGDDAFGQITDEDAPPEAEVAPMEEAQSAPGNPFAQRDIKDVGKRNVNAYMHDHPEVKPLFQAEASVMLGELRDTVKGERIYTETDLGTNWTGTSRHTSEDIAYLRDALNISYADIEKGLNAIINDNGLENNAVSKRIEFLLNDRLLYGYTSFQDGTLIPPSQDYINLLSEKNRLAHSEEVGQSIFETGDQFVPPAAEDIAPVAPAREEYEAIRPEKPKRETAQADTAADIGPVMGERMVRVDSNNGRPGENQRKWVGTSTESEAVGRKILPDDLNQDTIHYQPISNKTTLGNANARLDRLGYGASVAYFNSQLENKKTTLDDIALGERLIQEAVKRGDTQTAGELIQNIAILGTELGQKVQALSIIKRLTPEGQLGMLQKTINRGKMKGDKAFEGVELTQEMIDKILAAYGKDGTFDQAKLNKAVEDVKQEIADQMKVTALDKVNAWRYLSMLGNPKTHIRNLVSNVAMRGTVAVKNAVARTIETVAPIGNRTKTWAPATDTVKTFAQKTAAEMKDVLSDDSKYNEAASIKDKRRIFKNKVLNAAYEFNSDMLSKEDWWFSRPAFVNALSEFLTANGIRTEADIQNNPKLVEKAKLYATEQSQIATFRQVSYLAHKISEMEHKNAGWNIAIGSILPFKKTPINIAKTGLAYSPLGFMKTLTYDAAQVKNGKMEASELVDHLSQNLTGTALTLVGYLLASAGFLSGGGEDDKEGDYDYQLGEQSYSVNIGGNSYSLSWLSPVAMPLFVGANAYEQLVEGKEWNGDVVVETLAQTLDPLNEMSFLSGLTSVLSSYDSGMQKFAGIGEAMVQNYVTQFVPTAMSQVATVMDDTKRTTKAAGDSGNKAFDQTINKLKYKIPGLRQTLEPSMDIWGNEVKQTENVVARALETFLAPWARRENTATEIDEEIQSLYRATGDGGVIPSVPDNYVNYRDEKYEMSADEFTEFKNTYGQTAYNMLQDLMDTDVYQRSGADERADLVNRVYDYARDEAKRKFLKEKSVRYTNAKADGVEYYRENSIKGAIELDMTPDEYTFYRENPEKHRFLKEVGVSYEAYQSFGDDAKDAYTWAFENPEGYTVSKAVLDDLPVYRRYVRALNNIPADKDASGKTISGSAKAKKINYINSLDLDYGAKLVLFKSEYKADDTYNYEIVNYLNERNDITAAEMVTILKELGFEVDAEGNISW